MCRSNLYVYIISLSVTWRSLDSVAFASENDMNSIAVDSVDGQAQSTRVRRHFPEVWLFNSTTAGLV